MNVRINRIMGNLSYDNYIANIKIDDREGISFLYFNKEMLVSSNKILVKIDERTGRIPEKEDFEKIEFFTNRGYHPSTQRKIEGKIRDYIIEQ